MSQKVRFTQQHRRQIRRLVRESIRERQMLIESRVLIGEDIRRFNVEKDALGYTPRMIEEGVMDLLGAGLTSGIKQNIIEFLLKQIGFNKDSVVGRFLINLLENFNILGMNKYFGPEKCKGITELVAKASIETINELGTKRVVALLYSQFSDGKDLEDTEFGKNIETGMGKLIAAAGRETVNEVIYDFIGPLIEKPIQNIFCSYKSMTDFFNRGIFQGDLKDQVKDLGGVAAAGVGLGVGDAALTAAEDEVARRGAEKISGSGAEAARSMLRKQQS